MRLIDADALIAQMEADAEQMEDQIAMMFTYAAINDVKRAPTIEERKGKWLCSDNMFETGVCSCCDWDSAEPWEYAKEHFVYCPHCGIKMEEQP